MKLHPPISSSVTFYSAAERWKVNYSGANGRCICLEHRVHLPGSLGKVSISVFIWMHLAHGEVKPCLNTAELAKHGHMDIAVRFRGSPATRSSFIWAFRFYAQTLDMNWHIERSTACVIDVSERKWATAVVGQAHPDGRIEIDPRHLDARERYLVAVHEIGHELGLEHSKNKQGYSVMVNWIDDFRGTNMLDAADMAALRVRHQLR